MTLSAIVKLPGFAEGEFGIRHPDMKGDLCIDDENPGALVYVPDDEMYEEQPYRVTISDLSRSDWYRE